ncbi:MAG: type IX secretion system membrane protein PorP/SprF [Bacteroidales bacterium]|nr:type IX secretion system membrane protein PorP/SprF [Bacteroidales bacterium]
MKKSILVFFALTVFISAEAQQERQVSHYMYDHISINPGFAGSSDMISTHAIMRQQWVGIEGAPRDVILNLSAPFRLFGANHGAGLSIYYDEIGFNQDINLSLSYAYQFTLGTGRLGLGISGSFLNRKLDPVWSIPSSPIHISPDQDAAIPTGKQNEFVFDIGAGVFYQTDELYVGLSSTHIMQDEFVYQTEGVSSSLSEAKEKVIRHFYLTAGYTLQLSNPAFELQPSVFIQSDTRATKIDLNTVFMYNKKLWAGVTYRVGSAVVGMAGVNILNGVKIGYSYDFDTSALSNYSKGSHEVMIGYDFIIGIERVPEKYKSIRFL